MPQAPELRVKINKTANPSPDSEDTGLPEVLLFPFWGRCSKDRAHSANRLYSDSYANPIGNPQNWASRKWHYFPDFVTHVWNSSLTTPPIVAGA